MRPTDQETIANEKTVTHSSQEKGMCHTTVGRGGAQGKHQGCSEVKGTQEKCGQMCLLWLLWEEAGEAL